MPKRNRDRSVLQKFADWATWCEADMYMECCSGRHVPLHIHHVLGGANRIDAPWNLVRLCMDAHEWCHNHPQEGRILGWHILDSRGAFDPVVIRQRWQKCPLGVIEVALSTIQEDWIRRMGEVLLQKHSEDQS
jgi:hypothetical protein